MNGEHAKPVESRTEEKRVELEHGDSGPLCGYCDGGRMTWCSQCRQWSSTCCKEYGTCQCS